MNVTVHYLENQAAFDQIVDPFLALEWIGFDTEFVGEKTFIPVLCLIQIVTPTDIYLVDTLKIKDLSRFLEVIENPKVLKITHAGDNDYRLLNTLFGTVPKNTFDTQIAAGLVGYNYPAGFAKIVEKELRITLAKSHTVADWERRPLDPKAVDYAIEDVKYLPALHEKLMNKLRKYKREKWVVEENQKWEVAENYDADLDKELLANEHVYYADLKEKVFLRRLYRWRIERATTLNVTKESILQGKFIGIVVRTIKNGPNAFRANRTLPENMWKRHLDTWMELWKTPPNEEEIAFFEALPQPMPEDPEREWTMELLYHLIKKQCLKHDISAALLFPKGDFNRLKAGNQEFDYSLLDGWRAELMGAPLVNWLKRGNTIRMDWQDDTCTLEMLSTKS